MKRFVAEQNRQGEWMVYDNQDCYCVAGPLTETSAIGCAERLNRKHAKGLVWEKCEVSGQLKAEGVKGQYWIDEKAWSYLSIVSVDSTGPYISKLGQFHDINEAKEVAQLTEKLESEV